VSSYKKTTQCEHAQGGFARSTHVSFAKKVPATLRYDGVRREDREEIVASTTIPLAEEQKSPQKETGAAARHTKEQS